MIQISEYVQHEVYTGEGKDPHGNQIATWSTPVALGIYSFDPGGTSEPLIPGHDRVITKPTIHVPTDAVVSHRDRITITGEPNPFEVDGDMLRFRNPFDSSLDGNSIRLKAVAG